MMKGNELIYDASKKGDDWLLEKRTGSCWRVPVTSECLLSTVLMLHLVSDSRRQKIVDYLLKKEVWRTSTAMSMLLLSALNEIGEKALATKIAEQQIASLKESNDLGWGYDFAQALKLLSREGSQSLTKMRRKWLSLFFMASPEAALCSKTSQFYDYLPSWALLLVSLGKPEINHKVESTLTKALNPDGSYAGITVSTIKAAYVFRKLGNEHYAEKAMDWLDNTYNDNGSFRPLFCQDVYDTAWASLALLHSGEAADSAVEWLDSKRVDRGYPYYSGGYYPDIDDTSLILLLKESLSYIDEDDMRSVRFLLESQNPDGGWAYIPLLSMSHALPYRFGFKYIPSFDAFLRQMGSRLMWQRNYQSTIDMTSRALIALAHFKEDAEVKRAVANGASYLLTHFQNGTFHDIHRWSSSLVYETAMALIALFKNGIKNSKTDFAVEWLLNQKIGSGEEAGHVLWALLEGAYSDEHLRKLALLTVSLQKSDGSWDQKVPFSLGPTKYFSLFSQASPLYTLHLYIKRLQSN